ncbi:preprotein translocase, YajC subunit [Syntrophotalea carbinolica DSM 2380]|uniref:Sec translocon accessory complex subunit YajC n=1 Tax=Syntrophotalea carbinolica (strain DSM 2380 / NBRC 103641 / GraBd1) TaxID=338963 RepID=Q3A3C3_SYNC1|nr:preprotein translocase subunit YajC [Syntrophotalea carbinolica]ABA89134.1 preprotein translocase, YajC subunit [Syntrophotalea carbinolica DSM 2380]
MFWISEAHAMAAPPGGQSNPYGTVIMLVLMFGIFYFLLIRPQQKRAKEHKNLVDALKVGDMVVTAGGIHGKVASVQDEIVTLEVATGVKIKMNRSSIVSVGQN